MKKYHSMKSMIGAICMVAMLLLCTVSCGTSDSDSADKESSETEKATSGSAASTSCDYEDFVGYWSNYDTGTKTVTNDDNTMMGLDIASVDTDEKTGESNIVIGEIIWINLWSESKDFTITGNGDDTVSVAMNATNCPDSTGDAKDTPLSINMQFVGSEKNGDDGSDASIIITITSSESEYLEAGYVYHLTRDYSLYSESDYTYADADDIDFSEGVTYPFEPVTTSDYGDNGYLEISDWGEDTLTIRLLWKYYDDDKYITTGPIKLGWEVGSSASEDLNWGIYVVTNNAGDGGDGYVDIQMQAGGMVGSGEYQVKLSEPGDSQ